MTQWNIFAKQNDSSFEIPYIILTICITALSSAARLWNSQLHTFSRTDVGINTATSNPAQFQSLEPPCSATAFDPPPSPTPAGTRALRKIQSVLAYHHSCKFPPSAHVQTWHTAKALPAMLMFFRIFKWHDRNGIAREETLADSRGISLGSTACQTVK